MTQLGPQTITKIHTYIDDGVDINDLGLTKAQIERIRVAEAVYERLQQDPMLDINRCLTRTYGRTRQEAKLDKQVIEMFLEATDEPSRKLLMYRARKVAERLVRIGEQTGDAKWVDKGLSQLIRIDRLDEEDVPQEDVRNTATLPPILVPIEVVDPNRRTIDDQEFRAIVAKYGGSEDEFDRLVEMHRRRMDGEDLSRMSFEETEDVYE